MMMMMMTTMMMIIIIIIIIIVIIHCKHVARCTIFSLKPVDSRLSLFTTTKITYKNFK